MTIEFIYTFKDAPQVFVECPLEYDHLQDKNTLIRFALDNLDAEPDDLIKISCCVYDCISIGCPYWFKDCNGKIWEEDIIEYLYQL